MVTVNLSVLQGLGGLDVVEHHQVLSYLTLLSQYSHRMCCMPPIEVSLECSYQTRRIRFINIYPRDSRFLSWNSFCGKISRIHNIQKVLNLWSAYSFGHHPRSFDSSSSMFCNFYNLHRTEAWVNTQRRHIQTHNLCKLLMQPNLIFVPLLNNKIIFTTS